MAVQFYNYSGAITASSATVAGNTVYPQAQIPADHGYIAWTYTPAAQASQTAVPTSGRLEVVRILRVPAGTITNIVMFAQAGGTSLTWGMASLYNSAGSLLSSTADQTSAWGSSGLKTMPLSTPQVVTAGDYYVGFWFVGAGGPVFIRQSGTLAAVLYNGNRAAPDLLYATANTGLVSTPPPTLGTQTAANLTWWLALS